jgi:pyruvate dehydrogenase E2 component (dihydrolipoamide acetyltransferase)
VSADRAIRLPQLGLTMTEGTLLEWLVQPGEHVTAGQLLYVCETEKIANEIAADRAGVIGELLVAAGDTVPVGTVLARWVGDGTAPVVTPDAAPGRVAQVGTKTMPEPAPSAASTPAGARVIATPHARKLARSHGVDLRHVRGSGPKGRIRRVDVLAAAATPTAVQPAAVSVPTQIALGAAQRVVAQRMAQSKREVPHFYLEAAANVGALLELHDDLKKRSGYAALTLTHWIVHAVGLVLAEHPAYRRVWAGDGLLELPGSDVAVAAATERGLYVPVARDLARRGLAANCAYLTELTRRAREGRLTAADSTGGATCVSNLGASGVRRVFPIILPGQSTILGVGRSEALFRPDHHGAPALVRELGLVLACDHRVFNGVDGAGMLAAVIARLEDPLGLVLHGAG